MSTAVSWCRHCGRPTSMTREHIPPKSTGNDGPVSRKTDSFDLKSALEQVVEWDDGHVVDTLGQKCNERASNWGYVKEYRNWHVTFIERARDLVATNNENPLEGTKRFEIELAYDAHPARFVRQVLGMFLAVQESHMLLADHPSLAELIGSEPGSENKRRESGVSISPLRLYMSVGTSFSYATQPVASVQIDLGGKADGLWTPQTVAPPMDDLWILCLQPFAFLLTDLSSNDFGQDITNWTLLDQSHRFPTNQRQLSLPTVDQLQPGVRAIVYPEKYRTA